MTNLPESIEARLQEKEWFDPLERKRVIETDDVREILQEALEEEKNKYLKAIKENAAENTKYTERKIEEALEEKEEIIASMKRILKGAYEQCVQEGNMKKARIFENISEIFFNEAIKESAGGGEDGGVQFSENAMYVKGERVKDYAKTITKKEPLESGEEWREELLKYTNDPKSRNGKYLTADEAVNVVKTALAAQESRHQKEIEEIKARQGEVLEILDRMNPNSEIPYNAYLELHDAVSLILS